MSLLMQGTYLDMYVLLTHFACTAINNCLISYLLHVTILLVQSLQLQLPPCNYLMTHDLKLYKLPDNIHRIYSTDFHLYNSCKFIGKISSTMTEAVLVKSNNGAKKRKGECVGGNKSKKSLASTSSAKISESFEDCISSLLMSNVPTSQYNDNEGKSPAYNLNEGREGVIKRTFHLGGTKYVIFQGSQGLIENIYMKEWEDGEVKNQGIILSIPKLGVILHYVDFIMSAIQKISYGKKEVDSRYHFGFNIYVTCAFPYRNVSIRFWKLANGKKYPAPEGVSFSFNKWNEFIKVGQRMYSEYTEIYSCQPCILDEDRSEHHKETCEEFKTFQETLSRGEVNEDIPV